MLVLLSKIIPLFIHGTLTMENVYCSEAGTLQQIVNYMKGYNYL
jgi:hypothetical protein